MKSLLSGILLALALTQLAAEEQPYDKYSARVTRFIEDCVYGVTTNDKKQLSRRIAEPYTVYIDCEDKDFAAKVLDRVLTIGAATGLKPSVAPLQEAATMHIYIKPAAELMRLDTPYVRNIDLKTGRYYHLWWDESCNITKANIYLVSNAFRNDDARMVAFTWACMAAFGLNGSSKEFKDTNMNPTNTSPEFYPLDAKLLRFLYEYVPPGTEVSELRKIVREYWAPETPVNGRQNLSR